MRVATWREFREIIGADKGALPDGIVEDTSIRDWQAVLDGIVEQGWDVEYVDVDGDSSPMPRAAAAFPEEGSTVLRVKPSEGVQVNVWPQYPGTFDFDLDPRELLGEVETHAAMAFIRFVGRTLQRVVRIMPEGASEDTMIRYDPELDAFRVPA